MKSSLSFCRGLYVAALQLAVISSFCAQLQVTSTPFGYTVRSVELGDTFAGAIAPVPGQDNVVYVSSGDFGAQRIIRVNTDTGTTVAVSAPLGAIGGMAVLGNGDLAVTESLTSETILRLRDTNSDGDFLDPFEVRQMIAPILTEGGNFTGSQVAVAPAGNASAIPEGSLLVQTADDETSSELLIVENAAGSAVYRPAGGSYYSGYQFNGGLAFDATGNVIFGISQLNFVTFASSGKIVALVNTDADTTIGAGESNVLVGEALLGAGLTDLAVSKEGVVFYGENSGAVKKATLPANLLTGPASSPEVFLNTNSAYISAIRFHDASRAFAAGAASPRARMYVGGLDSGYQMTTNLLIVEPVAASAVEDWELFE